MEYVLYTTASLISFYICNLIIRKETYKDEYIGTIYRKYQVVINLIFTTSFIFTTEVDISMIYNLFISFTLLNVLIMFSVIYCRYVFKNNISKINQTLCFISGIFCVVKFLY